MPLLLDKNIDNNTRLAVWKVDESNDFFISKLGLSKSEKEAYADMRPHRQQEWVSSRYLLHLISADKKRRQVVKAASGKPSRKGCEKYISLSHSKNLIAAMISDKRVGLDIQKEEAKISRIQHKFISENEYKRIPEENILDYYHVFWGAKESMYKAYGLKELEFKDHMYLFPFSFYSNKIEIKGWVDKEQLHQDYDISVEKLAGAYLIYCIMTDEKINE